MDDNRIRRKESGVQTLPFHPSRIPSILGRVVTRVKQLLAPPHQLLNETSRGLELLPPPLVGLAFRQRRRLASLIISTVIVDMRAAGTRPSSSSHQLTSQGIPFAFVNHSFRTNSLTGYEKVLRNYFRRNMRSRAFVVVLVVLAGQLEAAPLGSFKTPHLSKNQELWTGIGLSFIGAGLAAAAVAKSNQNNRNNNGPGRRTPQTRPVEPPPQSRPPLHLSLDDILKDERGRQILEEYRKHRYTDEQIVNAINAFNSAHGASQTVEGVLAHTFGQMDGLFRRLGPPPSGAP